MVGMHIRLEDSIMSVLKKAENYNIPIFQTFLINTKGKKVRLSDEEIQQFKKESPLFKHIYIHASYWVNLAGKLPHGLHALYRELTLASKLNLNTIVLHPGSAVGFDSKLEGINIFTKRLNKILEEYPEINLILENTTHAKKCIGSDIEDFKIILSQINEKDRVSICLDTAHAYGYGYDLSQPNAQDEFINLVDQSVGLKNVSLIHLNDSVETLGSKLDRHALPGRGNIGKEALCRFIGHTSLSDVPIILEMPASSENEERETLTLINNWRNN